MPATYGDRLRGLTTSVAVKAPCRVATTANITLSGLQTIDTETLVAGDRVLVKNQTNAIDNGIWVAGVAAWTRALDFDGPRDAVAGTVVFVLDGSQARQAFMVDGSSSAAIDIGADEITFSENTYASFYRVSLAAGTWAVLDAIDGTYNGQSAAVFGDGGTHTDPVVGGTVDNEGVYSWSTAEEGWERIANLEAADAAAQVALAEDARDLSRLYAISDTNTPITGAVSTSDRGSKYWAGVSESFATNANVTAVAADLLGANTIGAVAGALVIIDTVATDLDGPGNINTVAGNITNVNALGALDAEITALAGIAADITTVAANDANVTTLAALDAEIAALGPISANITTVAGISGNVTTVAGISANVTTIAGLDTEIATLAGISADITTVAAADAAISTVSTNIADVNTLADLSSEIATLADISGDITDVAAVASDIPQAAALRVLYGRGAPDAMTGGVDGASYVEQTSGDIYGPKASGSWPVTYRKNPYSFGEEPATVFVMVGQSNRKGYSTNPSATTSAALGTGYEYYANGNGRGSILPLGPVRLGRTYGGSGVKLCKDWAAGGGGAGIVIDASSGGSSMSKTYTQGGAGTLATGATTGNIPLLNGGTWDLSDPKNLYVNVIYPHIVRALAEIREHGFNIVRLVFVWSQGEQDALGGSSQATYDAAFRVLLTRIKSDFPEAWFLIDALGTNSTGANSAACTLIRNAQIAVAADAAYSGWVTVASNRAKDYYLDSATYFSAEGSAPYLHYSQQGYEEIDADLASNGLTFTGLSGLYAAPGTAKGQQLLSNLPPVGGWKRCALKTKANGSFGLSSFLDPNMPYATTFYDVTWANRTDTAQTLAWTFPDATEKEIICYMSDAVTGNTTLTGTSTSAISDMTAIDEGFPLHTIAMTTAGAQVTASTAGAASTAAAYSTTDLYRLSGTKMRSIAIGTLVANTFVGHAITNTLLDKLPNLTTLDIDRAPLTTTLDLTKCPGLTRHNQSRSGLSVAEVNARLVALDANGQSNGNCGLAQFLSGVYPTSPPSGAGATAKTSLIGKGWTVSTD